jgi:histidyl-tRNA synthetase
MPWADVRKEMTEEKGLDGEVADRIGEYVKLKGESALVLEGGAMLTAIFSRSGGPELVQQLKQDARLTANKSASEGLNDMELLYTYLDIFGVSSRVRSAISRKDSDPG